MAADFTGSVFSASQDYIPSGSAWGTSISESQVMAAVLSNVMTGNTNRSWELRVAKGGNIYSLRHPALGETVPPQWQSTPDTAPWTDEVWQGVAVSSLNNPPDSPYFIHQSGVYWLQDPVLTAPFYMPQLASALDVSNRVFSTVNWPVQAHVKIYADGVVSNDWKSYILCYTRYRDLGDGVIEGTLGYYNYGPDLINWINMPWGGVRRTSMEYPFLSTTNGAGRFIGTTSGFGVDPPIEFNNTGGWVGFSATTNGSSPSMGFVFGRDRDPLPPNSISASWYRWGYAGGAYQNNLTNWRNYFVSSNVRRYNLSDGNGIWSRFYFVFGDDLADVEARIAARGLVDIELREFDYKESNTPLIGYSVSGSGSGFSIVTNRTSPDFLLYAHPVERSLPLFEITRDDASKNLTWNPYAGGVIKPYDGSLAGIRLLGFAMRQSEQNLRWTSYRYGPLEDILAAAPDYYMPEGRELAVRLPDPYGDWAESYGLDDVNVSTAAVLNTVGVEHTGRMERDSEGFRKYQSTAWAITNGYLVNTGSLNDVTGESVLGRMIDLGGFSNAAADALTLEFDYFTRDAGEYLYGHLWGYTDVNSTPGTYTMNIGAPNGKAWESSAGALTAYNLGKPNGAFTGIPGFRDDAAMVLTGSSGFRSFSNTFVLSSFTGAPNRVVDYDYLAIGFGREVGTAQDPSVIIRNVRLYVPGGETLFEFVLPPPARDPLRDLDDDTLLNGYEYAIGGNPTSGGDAAVLPVLVNRPAGGSNDWTFVYRRRIDAAARGLIYRAERSGDLISGLWTTGGVEETGSGPVDEGFESVTNRVPEAVRLGVRLRVEMEKEGF